MSKTISILLTFIGLIFTLIGGFVSMLSGPFFFLALNDLSSDGATQAAFIFGFIFLFGIIMFLVGISSILYFAFLAYKKYIEKEDKNKLKNS